MQVKLLLGSIVFWIKGWRAVGNLTARIWEHSQPSITSRFWKKCCSIVATTLVAFGGRRRRSACWKVSIINIITLDIVATTFVGHSFWFETVDTIDVVVSENKNSVPFLLWTVQLCGVVL